MIVVVLLLALFALRAKGSNELHIALESSSLQGFYAFKMYERWLHSRCYSLFRAGIDGVSSLHASVVLRICSIIT